MTKTTMFASRRLFDVCIILALVVTVSCADDEDFKLDPLPNNASYASAGAEYNDGGMAPLFNFARSFINSALPGGFDQDYVEDILNHGFKLDKIQELLKKFVGYVTAIVIGILFVVILPIVGTCFCCCRLCGNCGGRRVQEPKDTIHCRRRVYSCVMFVITIFILVGNICTYVSNDRLSQALGNIGDTVEHNLEDIDKFLDVLSLQINTIGVTNLQKTKDATLKYMQKDDLKKFVSKYILDTLSNGALNNMDAHIQELGKIIGGMENKSNAVNTAYQDMCQSAPPAFLCQGNPFSPPQPMFVIVNTTIPKFKAFKNSTPTESAKATIEAQVNSSLPDLTNTSKSVNDSFGKIGEQVQNIQTQIAKFRNDTHSGFDIKSITKDTKSATDTVKQFDKYRHSAGAALGAMITLVVVLQFVGIAFGTVGQGMRTSPTERGCVSNSGGNMLIASVAFIFIFSSLLMLLTTLCFAVGAIAERFFCQPLSDSELTLLKFAGKHVPGDILQNASLADIMLQCKSGKTVYQAFPLLQSKFNISEVQANMAEQQEKMNKNTSESLKDIASSITGASFANNATSHLSELNDSISTIDFDAINTQRSAIQLARSGGTQAKKFADAMTEMLDLVDSLKPLSAKVGDWSAEFEKGMNDAQTNMSNTAAINETVQKFVQRIIEPVNEYIKTTKNDVETQMGRCSPLWNMYNSIVVISVCKYTIDAFNGFWFSIGWCLFFFMPGVVIAVKLAKHYRRMDPLEDDEELLGMQPIKNNQVAPTVLLT